MEQYLKILTERFGNDSLMALATVDENGIPWVRTIDAIFHDGSFYTITYALSNKMQHISRNPIVAISGEWFSGHAIGENLGHIQLAKNFELAQKLRSAFASWYDNGHINEEDINTVSLKLKVTDGTLFSNGTQYKFSV